MNFFTLELTLLLKFIITWETKFSSSRFILVFDFLCWLHVYEKYLHILKFAFIYIYIHTHTYIYIYTYIYNIIYISLLLNVLLYYIYNINLWRELFRSIFYVCLKIEWLINTISPPLYFMQTLFFSSGLYLLINFNFSVTFYLCVA